MFQVPYELDKKEDETYRGLKQKGYVRVEETATANKQASLIQETPNEQTYINQGNITISSS